MKALVDSGSSLCCIKKSLLQKLCPGLTSFKHSKCSHVKGISSKLIQVDGTIRLTIKIGEQDFEHDSYIFDDIHHSLIIGIDFLQEHKCTLNFAESQFETKSGDRIIGFHSAFKIGLVRLTQTIDLKPMSECLVPMRLSNIADGGVALLEHVKSLENKENGLARTVVRPNKGRAMCRVLNPLSCQKHLQSGTVNG